MKYILSFFLLISFVSCAQTNKISQEVTPKVAQKTAPKTPLKIWFKSPTKKSEEGNNLFK